MAGGSSGRSVDLILDNALGPVASRLWGRGAAVYGSVSVHLESAVDVAFNSEKRDSDDVGL